MMNLAEKSFGKIDVIFNNAGLMHGRDDDAINTEEDVWDLTMDVNVKGVNKKINMTHISSTSFYLF